MVVDINWNSFKSKFNNQEQTAFERLCYLLFCKEHGKDTGIIKFKNQAGIETNPIEINGEIIGWQAKFYGTPLSQHTAELIQSIDTTKARYPTVTRLIFYTNQDFGQDKKKADPQYKTNIETHAKAKGIDIEWRTASYFESPFVSESCSSIAEHFFSLKKGILDSVAELALHTEALLKPIHSEIPYKDSKIKLDRSGIVESVHK
ncbi:MAG: AVAST type 4 anti-phage nuclease Avs4, partial [Candidatus Angelobacter sp.]